MPPTAKHSPAKLFLFQMLAAFERPLRKQILLQPEHLRTISNFLFLQYYLLLGSAVHATPLFEAIRKTLPNAHISVAASPMAANVLEHNPYIDSCVVTSDPWQNFLAAVGAVQSIANQFPSGPVCIATTLGNQRSQLAFLAMFAGKAVRAGYMLAAPLYDLPLDIDPFRSQIECNVEILRVLGHVATAPEPRIFFTEKDAADAEMLLHETGHAEVRTRIVYVTQNSGLQPNLWRSERFQQVIRTLTHSFNAHPIFVGSAQESPSIEQLRSKLQEKGTSLAGKTTIPQLAAVLAQCDAAISLDTGTFHVARAVQLPGVVIAPGWQNPVEWLPLNHPRYRVLWGGPTLEQAADPFIDEISVEQVLAATNAILQSYPPAIAARQARLQAVLCDNTSHLSHPSTRVRA